MVVLKDSSGFKREHDNGFVWTTEYKERITKADFKKRKEFLEKNIETLKENIKSMDFEEFMKDQNNKLDLELNANKEALENFDKYFEASIQTMKDNKGKKKQEIQGIVDNFEKAKKIFLTQAERQFNARLEPMKFQLQKDEEQYEYFRQVK